MFEVGDKVRLKQDLMFSVTPLTLTLILHKNFSAGIVGKVIYVHLRNSKAVFPESIVVEFYTPYSPIHKSVEPDYSISFMGKEQIEKFLEKVES